MSMNVVESDVVSHYQRGGLLDKIDRALVELGKDPANIDVDDLAPVDAFHTRGRESTVELAEKACIGKSDRILDVGCGIGGSARFLAHRYGAIVTGIDLTQEYIDTANGLTERLALQPVPRFLQGSALELPFEAASFDIVWTEHAQMNIADKARFFAEIARVLKPGGRLVFHDIMAAGESAPIFPVPWAEHDSLSALADQATMRNAIETAGLTIQTWESKVEESIAFFENVMAKVRDNGMPPLGIHILMGETAGQKIKNYVESMKQGRLYVALGVCQKS